LIRPFETGSSRNARQASLSRSSPCQNTTPAKFALCSIGAKTSFTGFSRRKAPNAILQNPAARELKENLGRELAVILDRLAPTSILEAGVGEATSLAPVLNHMKGRPAHVLGFDLSLSRLLFARKHLEENGHGNPRLFVGDLERIPLASSSVDVVVTVHAIEPNHGREEVILSELLRIAGRHLVMIEPSYEMASPEGRARMDRLGYVRGLPAALKRLGHPARLVERWQHNSNPLNEAALVIVDKSGARTDAEPQFISPISGSALVKRGDCWFSPEDGHAFPVVAGIPCLAIENAVLASKLGQF
jgi:ubiquinone/menaquinone biosynthesis C-methylase UbiE